MKSWFSKRHDTNADAIVVGLSVAVVGPLILSLLSAVAPWDVLPPLVWLIVAGVAAVFLVGVLVGRPRKRVPPEDALRRAVENARNNEERLRKAQEQLSEQYAEHVHDALDTLQRVLAGAVPGDVRLDEFVREGLFEPAHALLTQAGTRGDVRFSHLRPEGNEFKMVHALGHDMESRRRFRLPITGSFAGLAFQSGEMKWSNDLEGDARYTPHPRARAGREYQSMVAVPLKHGDDVKGVLVVIATEQEAFTAADRIYIRTLGTIHDVTWAVIEAREREEREAS